jgi:hypothetical protein
MNTRKSVFKTTQSTVYTATVYTTPFWNTGQFPSPVYAFPLPGHVLVAATFSFINLHATAAARVDASRTGVDQ